MSLPLSIQAQDSLSAIGWVLLHFLWQGLVIGAAAAIGLAVFRDARSRYLVLCVSLALLLAAPITTALTTVLATTGFLGTAPDSPAPPGLVVGFLSEPVDSVRAVVASNRIHMVLPYAAVGWMVGVALLCLWRIGGFCLLRRLREQADAAGRRWQEIVDRLADAAGLTEPVALLVGKRLDTPAVIGWLRPAILFPVSALTGLPQDQVEAILLHELVHIRRRDHWVNVAQSVAETMLFFHPVVWWVSRRLRVEREFCCDDAVVDVLDHRQVYARALASLEALRPAPVPAVAARGGELLSRIQRLSRQDIGPARSRLGAPLAVAIVATVVAAAVWSVAPDEATARDAADDGTPVVFQNGSRDTSPVGSNVVRLVLTSDRDWVIRCNTAAPDDEEWIDSGDDLPQLKTLMAHAVERCGTARPLIIERMAGVAHDQVRAVMDIARQEGFVDQVVASVEPPLDRRAWAQPGYFKEYQIGGRTVTVPAFLVEQLPDSVRDGRVAALLQQMDRLARSMVSASKAPPAIVGPPFKVEYSVYSPTTVLVAVYDSNGMEVFREHKERTIAGVFEAVWDGKLASGAELPPGVYFLKVYVGDGERAAVHKLILR